MTTGLSLLAGIAVALGWYVSAGWVRQWIESRRRDALVFQRQLNAARPSRMYVWGAPLLAALTVFLFWLAGPWMLGLLVAFFTYKMISGAPRRAVAARARKFDSQLVDALVGLSNSLRAGMALPQAVQQVAETMPAPAGEEFDHVIREYEHGKPIEQAFEDLRERVDSRNFELAIAAFQVGKERGGNLAVVFDRIANSIREIWRLEEHIKTTTTQGRSSARFMTMMPAVFLVLLYAMDSESMLLLFTDPVGIGILTVVVLINAVGHLWIRSILAVDV